METFAEKAIALLGLFGIDFLFVIPLVVGLVVLAAVKRPAFAVLKRNFVAYFTNPTGYVFLCLFVALTSIVAFWGDGFFSSNLANLDQLNRYLPLIMLIFIPAITMSIWAEERRQGTDELLLTIPADDFDIVLGKYLSAVAIFTVSLLFSQVCNFLVLVSLGNPDTGLFLGNYFGYWMVGLAMLAIGMVASFLTSNLTVGFILGVVFCSPLVIASWADIVFGDEIGRKIAQFSVGAKFYDFQSGVISSASVVYFSMIIVVMMYFSMVLIGRRHWSGGRDGTSMGGHYAIRALALIVIAASLSVAAAAVQAFRWDVTSEQLGSLSEDSTKLVEEATESDEEYVTKIEAFISKKLPEEFVQKRFNLLSALQEIKAEGGDRIKLIVHDGIDIFGENATRAETLYGIKKESTFTEIRGAATTQEVIFGVAFEHGLRRAVVPFMGESLPVEYELMRSLATVTQQDRKTIGILDTDARLMSGGGFRRQGSSQRPVVEELSKQYKVVQVDPSQPITDTFDVLLAPQPSSLNPTQMQNFVDAVKRGQPTAIFEDPFPITSSAPGTNQPKQAPGGMPFMQQRPEPKGDIAQLWNLLGVKMVGGAASGSGFGFPPPGPEAFVVWQDYNPHPDDAELQNEYVWITPACREDDEAFAGDQSITSGLQKMLFLYPGAIEDVGSDVGRSFTELVTMGRRSGTVGYNDCIARDMLGQADLRPREGMRKFEKPTGSQYVLAAAIRINADKSTAPDAESDLPGGEAAGAKKDIRVVLVTDLDVLSGVFFLLRERAGFFGERFAKWEVDNVPFVLNSLDYLSGDERFVEIRKRRPVHRELTAIKRLGDRAKKNRNSARKKAEKKFSKILEDEQAKYDKTYDELEARTDIGGQQKDEELAIARKNGRDRITARKAQLDREEQDSYRQIDNEMAADIHRVQDNYKLLAVLLPPIPPLLIAVCVFFVRRSRERESVSASRLR